eukprot:6183608-Pleurochrysis_carterae.AAC.6
MPRLGDRNQTVQTRPQYSMIRLSARLRILSKPGSATRTKLAKRYQLTEGCVTCNDRNVSRALVGMAYPF